MYTIRIPHDRETKTEQAIQHFLAANPECDVDEAIDALFQMGVAVMCAVAPLNGSDRSC